MKLLLVLGLLAATYVIVLDRNTDIVMGQLKQLQASYQQISEQADAVAASAQ